MRAAPHTIPTTSAIMEVDAAASSPPHQPQGTHAIMAQVREKDAVIAELARQYGTAKEEALGALAAHAAAVLGAQHYYEQPSVVAGGAESDPDTVQRGMVLTAFLGIAELERIAGRLALQRAGRAALAATLFGQLPDELLVLVLGFLPMRTVYGAAIRVCRRWRQLIATPAVAGLLAVDVRLAKYACGDAQPVVLEYTQTTLWALALSPDGERLYGAAGDDIRVWSTVDFSHVHTVHNAHAGEVIWMLAMSPGGRLYSGSKDGTVRAWSTTAAETAHLHTFPDHGGAMRYIALSLSGHKLYAVPDTGAVFEWSTADNSLCHTYATPDLVSTLDYPTGLAVSPDGARV